MKRSSARRARLVASALVAAVALLGASGCGYVGGKADAQQEAGDGVAADAQAALAARPDVERAEVVYQNTVNASAVASVTVRVKAGADLQVVLDEATRLLWQSKLTPLRTVSVYLTDAGDSSRGLERRLDFREKDRAELERRWGPRPVE